MLFWDKMFLTVTPVTVQALPYGTVGSPCPDSSPSPGPSPGEINFSPSSCISSIPRFPSRWQETLVYQAKLPARCSPGCCVRFAAISDSCSALPGCACPFGTMDSSCMMQLRNSYADCPYFGIFKNRIFKNIQSQ